MASPPHIQYTLRVLLLCCLQVYRGKWCNIDIAAKEYLAVDDGECEQLTTANQEPSEAAKNRAKVSVYVACFCGVGEEGRCRDNGSLSLGFCLLTLSWSELTTDTYVSCFLQHLLRCSHSF